MPTRVDLRAAVGDRLPNARPPTVPEREWHALARVLRDAATYVAIGRELGVHASRARELAVRAVTRLRAAGLLAPGR